MQSKKSTKLLLSEKTKDQMVLDISPYRAGLYLCQKEDGEMNEDASFIHIENALGFLGVADGAGGHALAHEASSAAAQVFLEDKKLEPYALIEKANEKVLSLNADAKTTLAFAELLESQVRFFSIGDSEILFLNSRADLIYSNIPQSTVGHKIEGGLVSQEDSLFEEERHIVHNLMGDEYIRIESTNKLPFKKGYTLVIGSDGLFDNISHEKIISTIGKGDFIKSFEALVELCESKEDWVKDDDISFIVLRKISA